MDYLLGKKNLKNNSSTNLSEKKDSKDDESTIVPNKVDIPVQTKIEDIVPKPKKKVERINNTVTPYTVDSLNQIVAFLKIIEDEFDTINLIDFENVAEYKELIMEKSNERTINIFFYNACIYSNDFFKINKYIESKSILQVLTYDVAEQLVDHMITFYLGGLLYNYSDKEFNIISRDTGFCQFVKSLDSENVTVHGVKYSYDAEERYKFSLCKYILNNKILQNRPIITKAEFGTVFSQFYKGKTLTDKCINDIINSALDFGIICLVSKGGFVYYKFEMDKIKEIVNA